GSRGATPQQIEEGITLCRDVLGRYGVLDDPSWSESPVVRLLPAEERDRLRQELGQLLLLYARAVTWQAEATGDAARRSERIQLASRLNALASASLQAPGQSRALWLHRAELARLAGREDEARRLREQAEAIPLRTPMDRFWVIADQLDRGERRDLLATVQEVSRHDPQNFTNWLLLGNCYVRLGQLPQAASCYSTGIALRPDLHWSYLNRGLAYLDLKDYPAAIADFDRVIELRPDLVDAYINRALAKLELADFSGAVD